jgi:Kef-type K+ transport system membrane component KefB
MLILLLADLVAAVLLAVVVGILSREGNRLAAVFRSLVVFLVVFVLGSFLIYLGVWFVIRDWRGA